jgi:glutathione S-transferase
VLLILADSGTHFEYEEVPLVKWGEMKKTGQVTPATFPYGGVPVLRVTDKSSEQRSEFLLGETPAILSYLEEILSPPGATLNKELPLQTRARIQMIREASMFFTNRVWQLSVEKDWLAPPSRDKIWKAITVRYLRNTEAALRELQKETKVVPAETDRLTTLHATVAAAITFITQLFPSAQRGLTSGGDFPLCGQLWMAVMTRPRVVTYWKEHTIAEKAWTITEYGTAEWIAREAAKYDSASLLAKL